MLIALYILEIHSWLFGYVEKRLDKKANVNAKVKPLSANSTKWSNTIKQFVGKLPMQAIEIWSVDKIKEKFPSKMKQKMKKGD